MAVVGVFFLSFLFGSLHAVTCARCIRSLRCLSEIVLTKHIIINIGMDHCIDLAPARDCPHAFLLLLTVDTL